jgi:hypothetical protein
VDCELDETSLDGDAPILWEVGVCCTFSLLVNSGYVGYAQVGRRFSMPPCCSHLCLILNL